MDIMKIETFTLYQYSLALNQPLTIREQALEK